MDICIPTGKAEVSGAHVAIGVDYDIPGVLIASKLKGALWLGVNEETLRHFGISKQDKQRVVPYNPKRKRITDINFEDLVNSEIRNIIELFELHDQVFMLKDDEQDKLHVTKENVHKLFLI